jgi:hypothetical protein
MCYEGESMVFAGDLQELLALFGRDILIRFARYEINLPDPRLDSYQVNPMTASRAADEQPFFLKFPLDFIL